MSRFDRCYAGSCGHNHGFGGVPVPYPVERENHGPSFNDVLSAHRMYKDLEKEWAMSEKEKKERDKDKKPPTGGVSVSEMWTILIVGCLPMGWLLTTIGKYCILGIQTNMQQMIAPH